jgi:glycosyltransferase involved in cell wall biosynthesis
MKILFDHQIFNNQNYGGISRYFYELTKGLDKLGVSVCNSISFSENEFTSNKTFFQSVKFPNMRLKGHLRLKKFLNQHKSETLLKKAEFDIFHPTYYESYFLKKLPVNRPFVLTFHDLIHEKFASSYPEFLNKADQEISNRRLLLEKASKVIAVSSNTKNDIIDYYKISEDKIEVIYLANSLTHESLIYDKSKCDYILFVGVREAYKNWEKFIKAVAPLLIREKHLTVKSAGGGPFKVKELELLNSLGIQKQVAHVSVSTESLPALYHNALLFVFPSLYEGFGIPVLEAFNCECPVVLSNISSLPEVGADAALYFDPTDEIDIRTKIEMLVYNEDLRNEYKRRGLQRARTFSWDRTSNETLNIYNSVM